MLLATFLHLHQQRGKNQQQISTLNVGHPLLSVIVCQFLIFVLFCFYLIAIPVILTPNNLSMLSKYLHNVSPKWYTLGIQLGLSKEMLARLVPVNYDPAFHLNQVLSTWLQCANSPTLDALCTALSHATVGAERLAEWLLRRKFNPTYRYLLAYTWQVYETCNAKFCCHNQHSNIV